MEVAVGGAGDCAYYSEKAGIHIEDSSFLICRRCMSWSACGGWKPPTHRPHSLRHSLIQVSLILIHCSSKVRTLKLRSFLCALRPMRSRPFPQRTHHNGVAKLHKALKLCPSAPLREIFEHAKVESSIDH